MGATVREATAAHADILYTIRIHELVNQRHFLTLRDEKRQNRLLISSQTTLASFA